MRYRRLSYRYTMIIGTEGLHPFGDPWRAERPGVVLAQPHWRPPTDVYETPSSVMVIVELGGVEQEQIEVLLFDNALVVEGQRQLPLVEAGGVYHSAEIPQGQFRVAVTLPASANYEGIEANYDRGLLQITLAKAKQR